MKMCIKILYVILGTLFVTLGLIGMLLPVVPTTPFLVIAGLFYIKSSEKLYNYLIHTRYFGLHVRNYVEYRRIDHRFKFIYLATTWIPTWITIIFFVSNSYVRLVSLLFALFVTVHIFSLESVKMK